jgi:outer membrane murein-binding lipoprotein Lpp
MTDPGNAEILAAIQSLAAKVDALDSKVDAVDSKVDGLAVSLDQLRQDVMAVKVDTGFIDRHIADFQAWANRHGQDPNAHHRRAA